MRGAIILWSRVSEARGVTTGGRSGVSGGCRQRGLVIGARASAGLRVRLPLRVEMALCNSDPPLRLHVITNGRFWPEADTRGEGRGTSSEETSAFARPANSSTLTGTADSSSTTEAASMERHRPGCDEQVDLSASGALPGPTHPRRGCNAATEGDSRYRAGCNGATRCVMHKKTRNSAGFRDCPGLSWDYLESCGGAEVGLEGVTRASIFMDHAKGASRTCP